MRIELNSEYNSVAGDISRMATLAASSAQITTDFQKTVDASSELKNLIKTYELIRGERISVGNQIDTLTATSDQPDVAELTFGEVASPEVGYPNYCFEKVLSTEGGIRKFFDHVQAHVPSENRAQLEADLDAALRLYGERKDMRDRWLEVSGMRALDNRDDELFDRAFELEDQICSLQCESLQDVALLATFADQWLPSDPEVGGEVSIERRSELLRSISQFFTSKM